MGRHLTDQEETDIQTYVAETNQLLADNQQKIASLTEQVESNQKEASAFAFDKAILANVLDKIAAAGLTTQDALPALKHEIQTNPNAVLGYLDKIATHVTKPAQPIGRSEKVASINSQPVNLNAASDASWNDLMSKIS